MIWTQRAVILFLASFFLALVVIVAQFFIDALIFIGLCGLALFVPAIALDVVLALRNKAKGIS